MHISRPVLRHCFSRNICVLSTARKGTQLAQRLHSVLPRPQTLSLLERTTPPHSFHHKSTYSQSSTSPHSHTSFADPSRPDLFYHVVNAPTPVSKTLPAFALSFSTEQPPNGSSETIIGWLPTQENVSKPTSGGDLTLADFVANPAFVKVLHSTIHEGLKEGIDEIQKATAMQIMNGWMHIHDQRNIPALNRIGEPDDIIGTVLVENSEILPETYQPMPAYRLVTADGVIQLTPGLAQKLQDALAKIIEAEKASSS